MELFIQFLPEILLITFTGLFIRSFRQESRRFRNALYLLIILFLLFLWTLKASQDTPLANNLLILFIISIVILIFVIPVLLIANGFQMIRREGIHLTSFLSISFGLFILAGEYAISPGVFKQSPIGSLQFYMSFIFGLIVLYVSLVFLAFMFYSFFIQILPRRVDFDYIIVLGAGLIDGKTPSKILSDRLDKAIQIFQKSMSSCYFVVSGGQGSDEQVSEAEAMRTYLIEHGIKNHQIICEDQSTNTYENIHNSYQLISRRKGRMCAAIVTSGFHVYRAILLCRHLQFNVTGIGAHTALYYWPSAMIREYAALCKYYLKPYIAGMFIFISVFLYIIHAL